MSVCINCQNLTKKYKCPVCLEPYCSLNCFKEHKAKQCQPKIISDVAETTLANEEPTCFQPFPTEDTVSIAELEELRHSESLRNLLYNPHLRNLLREIDVAPNAAKAMCAAMQEPLFTEFADECLKIIQPMNEEELNEARLLQS